MSKLKAFICTILLAIVVIALLFKTLNIEGVYGYTLFDAIASFMASSWFADRMINFYTWLSKDSNEESS